MPKDDLYEQKQMSLQTDSLFPQQGNETNVISISTFALHNPGGYPLLLDGPRTAAEASSFLELIRFYRKFMVRKKVFFSLLLFVYKSLMNGWRDLV